MTTKEELVLKIGEIMNRNGMFESIQELMLESLDIKLDNDDSFFYDLEESIADIMLERKEN